MKILTIVGARPQFIKAAMVSRAIIAHNQLVTGDPSPVTKDPSLVTCHSSLVTEDILHTGQHYDANMSDIFFKQMQIPEPVVNLNAGTGMHGEMTGRMLAQIEKEMVDRKPDLVLVYGDTNSTLAGALAAVKLHIPVAHVEAGLRSFNRRMPEEINRVLTDHASDLLFAPTETAVKNLKHEGIPDERVYLTGDVMYDAALFYRDLAQPPAWFDSLGVKAGDYVLATVHRAENTDDPQRLQEILKGLASCGRPVIFPIHPRTRKILQSLSSPIVPNLSPIAHRLSPIAHSPMPIAHSPLPLAHRPSPLAPRPSPISFVDPVSYLDMVWLEAHAAVIATDSGGVQKEAFFFRVPCVTLRDETEWVETVETGWNVVVGASADRIQKALQTPSQGAQELQPFGDGNASQHIARIVMLMS
jgi:UDP-GlcNAc3NAcA epimerase